MTDRLPYPAISGDRLRVYNLLRRIAAKHEVWLASLLEAPPAAAEIAHLNEFCAGLITAPEPRMHKLAHLPRLLRYGLAGMPLELKFHYSERFAAQIRQLTDAVRFDVVHIEHSHMAPYIEALGTRHPSKHLLAFHNTTYDQYAQISRLGIGRALQIRAWINSVMMRRWEPKYAERFDRCTTVSEQDRHMLMSANPHLRIDVIPNGVDTTLHQHLVAAETAKSLLFVGTMSYAPCTDAALYLCHSILPEVRQHLSDTQAWLVGAEPPPMIAKLNGNGIHVTGRVDDVIPYYEKCAVCVVPLRAGGGTRLKILEAMALGRPVVSTSIGCEGLDVVDGEHLLIADSVELFVERTVRLLTDKMLYERIATNARRLVIGWYDWDVIAAKLLRTYADLLNQNSRIV
jgi:polysaccharide biosynthesis protein PslH